MDLSKVKLGAVVRLTGKIVSVNAVGGARVQFLKGGDTNYLTQEEIATAELVSPPPVEFSKEQAAALKNELFMKPLDYAWQMKWIDSHTSKE